MHFEYDKDLPENFIADQLKISQILINLIGNSIKFTKNGDIWIRVYKIHEENNTYTLRFEVEQEKNLNSKDQEIKNLRTGLSELMKRIEKLENKTKNEK